MKWWNRFEFWLLLVLASLAGVFVLVTHRPAAEGASYVTNSQTTSAEHAPVLKSLMLEKDYTHARLDVLVQLTNASSRHVILTAPQVKLLNGKNKEVPLFFLPSQPPPSLPPQTTSDVRLRFWLEAADLEGKLQLEFQKQRLEIKSAKVFDLSALANAKPTTIELGSW